MKNNKSNCKKILNGEGFTGWVDNNGKKLYFNDKIIINNRAGIVKYCTKKDNIIIATDKGEIDFVNTISKSNYGFIKV